MGPHNYFTKVHTVCHLLLGFSNTILFVEDVYFQLSAFGVAGAGISSDLINLVNQSCGPCVAFVLWNWFGAVILKWSISFITSIFFLPFLPPSKRKRASCCLAESVYTYSVTSGYKCPVLGAAVWLCVAQAAWIAPANINLVQSTPLNFYLGWSFPNFSWFPLTGMTLWATVPIPGQVCSELCGLSSMYVCVVHGTLNQRFKCFEPAISALGDPEALSTAHFVSVCCSFWFLEVQEPKGKSLRSRKGPVRLVICL